MTGQREKEIYGDKSFEQFIGDLRKGFPQVDLVYHQSNVEGDLISWLQEYGVAA